jgi:hypothetical protein
MALNISFSQARWSRARLYTGARTERRESALNRRKAGVVSCLNRASSSFDCTSQSTAAKADGPHGFHDAEPNRSIGAMRGGPKGRDQVTPNGRGGAVRLRSG